MKKPYKKAISISAIGFIIGLAIFFIFDSKMEKQESHEDFPVRSSVYVKKHGVTIKWNNKKDIIYFNPMKT